MPALCPGGCMQAKAPCPPSAPASGRPTGTLRLPFANRQQRLDWHAFQLTLCTLPLVHAAVHHAVGAAQPRMPSVLQEPAARGAVALRAWPLLRLLHGAHLPDAKSHRTTAIAAPGLVAAALHCDARACVPPNAWSCLCHHRVRQLSLCGQLPPQLHNYTAHQPPVSSPPAPCPSTGRGHEHAAAVWGVHFA